MDYRFYQQTLKNFNDEELDSEKSEIESYKNMLLQKINEFDMRLGFISDEQTDRENDKV